MKLVSLKVEDNIFGETESILSSIKIPRNRYINEAIAYYNAYQKRQMLEKKLKIESELVNNESLLILNELEKMDYEH